MTSFVFIFVYVCAAACVGGCLARIVKYASMPRHLRWELYPVPHEAPERVRHGGSYFEEPDWWTKPRHFNLVGELRAMIPEMVFLQGLREFNPKVWFRSFPFHFGLYMVIGSGFLLGIRASAELLLKGAAPYFLTGGLTPVYQFVGVAGCVLVLLGATALLIGRLADSSLRVYTVPGDIFNLLFFIVAFGTLLAGYLLRGADAPGLSKVAAGLMRFDTTQSLPGLMASGMVFTAALAAYIPFTHMSHFIAKYFTYHSVRWDDAPSVRDGALQRRIAEYLTYRPKWAAAHVAANGKHTWAEIATHNPAQEPQQVEPAKR